MSKERDRVFFRNFSLIVASLLLMQLVFFIGALLIVKDDKLVEVRYAKAVAERTAPVGQVKSHDDPIEDTIAASPPDAGIAAIDGEKIYQGLCVACHGVQGIGAPVVGDVDGWAPRIAQGDAILYRHAIEGYTGPEGYFMPARGGGNLSDAEVKAAVDYMVNRSQ